MFRYKYLNFLIIIFLFFHSSIIFGNQNETKILFNSNKSGNGKIYIASLKDPKDIKMITSSKNYEFCPRWSEKAKKIVYCSLPVTSDGYGKSTIWTMDLDGKNQQQITKGGKYDDLLPNWSPDGKKIVFQSYRDKNGEIYIMDADGKNVKRLTNDDFEDAYPSFSPDGKKIMYQSLQPKKIKIILMNLDGSDSQPLFPDEVSEGIYAPNINLPQNSKRPASIVGGNNEFAPVFSPDGKKIYFIVDNYNYPPQIFEYNLDAQAIKRINTMDKKDEMFMDQEVAVSPDGKELLIITYQEIDNTKTRRLYLMELNTETRKQLFEKNFDDIWFPTWIK